MRTVTIGAGRVDGRAAGLAPHKPHHEERAMPRKPPPLTHAIVDEALQPSKRRIQLNDGACVGLSLRAGLETPTWVVRGSIGGTLRRVIGDPRTMPLPVARSIATEARDHHHAGGVVDEAWVEAAQQRHGIVRPVEPPYEEPPGPWTWAQGAEAFLRDLRKKRRSEVTITAHRKGLTTILHRLNDELIRDVSIDDVQEEVDRVYLSTPALAIQAIKAVRPYSQWFSIGPQRLKSGVDTHPFKSLVIPQTERRRPLSIEPVSLSAVARLVAICRTARLDPTTMRAVEVTVLTGLRRSTVVAARKDDISGDVWTVRAETLKRKMPLKVHLTPRLQELMRSDSALWVFPQPRQPQGRGAPPAHIKEANVGRATWEMPDVPTPTECRERMIRLLNNEHDARHTNLLNDAGASEAEGGDDKIYYDDGPEFAQTAADIRGDYIGWWSDALESLVAEEMAKLDADELTAAIKATRPRTS